MALVSALWIPWIPWIPRRLSVCLSAHRASLLQPLSLTLTSFSPRVLSLTPSLPLSPLFSRRLFAFQRLEVVDPSPSFSPSLSTIPSLTPSLSLSLHSRFCVLFPFLSLSLSRYNKSEKSPLFLPFVPLLSQGSVTGASAGDAEGGKGGSVASSIAAAVPPEKEDGRMLRKALAALA